MYRRKNVFRIVDLLAIISIITVLAAIFMPAAIGAKGLSSRAICLSNLKKLSMALIIYVQDCDGVLPSVDTAVNTVTEPSRGVAFCGDMGIIDPTMLSYAKNHSIRSKLDQYLGLDMLWKCPSDEGCRSEMAVGYRWSSYAYRLYIAEAPVTPFPRASYSLSDFRYPGENFIFSEVEPFHDDRTIMLPWTKKSGWDPSVKMNFAFLDGHARAVEIDRIITKNSELPGGWDVHWARDITTGKRSAWTPETRDMIATP